VAEIASPRMHLARVTRAITDKNRIERISEEQEGQGMGEREVSNLRD